VELSDGVALLTYKAKAKREDGSEYAALASSVYIKERKSWKLAFHQQTPVQANE
jgi:hypothetical protein